MCQIVLRLSSTPLVYRRQVRDRWSIYCHRIVVSGEVGHPRPGRYSDNSIRWWYNVRGLFVNFPVCVRIYPCWSSDVLGYTTAIFVTPIAILFLGERLNRVTLLGLVSALVGFLVLFNPGELNWSNKELVFGNAMLVACVILWSGVIIHLRVHRRVTDTLALVPWYLLVAFIVAATAALIYEGSPVFEVGITGWAIFLYAGVVCSGIGNWGVTTAIMNLPATTSTIGLLGVPVLALVISVAFLGEILTWSLLFGLVLIIFGIIAVTFSQRPEKRKLERENAL